MTYLRRILIIENTVPWWNYYDFQKKSISLWKIFKMWVLGRSIYLLAEWRGQRSVGMASVRWILTHCTISINKNYWHPISLKNYPTEIRTPTITIEKIEPCRHQIFYQILRCINNSKPLWCGFELLYQPLYSPDLLQFLTTIFFSQVYKKRFSRKKIWWRWRSPRFLCVLSQKIKIIFWMV